MILVTKRGNANLFGIPHSLEEVGLIVHHHECNKWIPKKKWDSERSCSRSAVIEPL